MEEQVGSWVSIQEAATLRGVSPDTIRNWIKASKVMSRKREIDQGFKYEVFLVDHQAVEIISPSSIVPTRSEIQDTEIPVPSIDLTPLADLTRELVNQIAQLQRENGALAEKLRLLEAPRKSWWKKVVCVFTMRQPG